MKDLEQEIMAYMRERNWHKLRPSDIAKSITIEAAELLEIFQWVNLTLAETRKDKEKLQKVKSELADIFIYCIDMSITLGFDTKQIIRDKLEIAKEKYPAALMRKYSNRKDPGSEKVYLKIKEAYRRREGRQPK